MTAGYEDPQRRRGTPEEQSRESTLLAADDSTELEYNRFVARTSAEALRMGRAATPTDLREHRIPLKDPPMVEWTA